MESLLQQLMKTSRSERQFISTIDTTTAGSSGGHARLLDCIAQLVNMVFDRYNNEEPTGKDAKHNDEGETTLYAHLHTAPAKPYQLV